MVRDGFREEMSLSSTIAKTSHLSTLLHHSSRFKERFDNKFGKIDLLQPHVLSLPGEN